MAAPAPAGYETRIGCIGPIGIASRVRSESSVGISYSLQLSPESCVESPVRESISVFTGGVVYYRVVQVQLYGGRGYSCTAVICASDSKTTDNAHMGVRGEDSRHKQPR